MTDLKEEYYKWVEKNDTYPHHSHKWVVKTYTTGPEGEQNLFFRTFGLFETKDEAIKWIREYRAKYTTIGFITRCSFEPICEVL